MTDHCELRDDGGHNEKRKNVSIKIVRFGSQLPPPHEAMAEKSFEVAQGRRMRYLLSRFRLQS